jgi:hypothetical protein
MSKKLLVTQKGCPGCAQVKEMLSEPLHNGELQEVPIESSRGRVIAEELDLDEVPECVEEENGKFTKCNLDALIHKYERK